MGKLFTEKPKPEAELEMPDKLSTTAPSCAGLFHNLQTSESMMVMTLRMLAARVDRLEHQMKFLVLDDSEQEGADDEPGRQGADGGD